MKRLLVTSSLLALALAATTTACSPSGGCPLLPTESEVTISPDTTCLSLHISGSQGTESGRCVDGLSVTGTNNCSAALTLTPPVAQDGGSAQPVTFAAGAAVSFDVDTTEGTDADGKVTWEVPATLGTDAVTITVVAQENGQ